MKNKVLKFFVVFLLLIGTGSGLLPVYANDAPGSPRASLPGISPLYANCDRYVAKFTVADGKAYVGVTYDGKPETFTQVKVTVQIQKKVYWFFWETVDIGLPNNEWVAYSDSLDGYFYQEFPINDTGKYRANFTLVFYGTDGTNDVIEDTIKCEYR